MATLASHFVANFPHRAVVPVANNGPVFRFAAGKSGATQPCHLRCDQRTWTKAV